MQSEGVNACVASVQERIRFFEQLVQQSQGCRLQLSARLAQNPTIPRNQIESIEKQIQHLHSGEVFHSHLMLQAQQHLRELLSTNDVSAANIAGISSCAANVSDDTATLAPQPSEWSLPVGQFMDNDLVDDGQKIDLAEALSSSQQSDNFSADAAVTEAASKGSDLDPCSQQSAAASNPVSAASDSKSTAPTKHTFSSESADVAAISANVEVPHGITVPRDRVQLSWNEFQDMNKGVGIRILSSFWRTTPWFKNGSKVSPLKSTHGAKVLLLLFDRIPSTMSSAHRVMQMSWSNGTIFRRCSRERTQRYVIRDVKMLFGVAHFAIAQDIRHLYNQLHDCRTNFECALQVSNQHALRCEPSHFAPSGQCRRAQTLRKLNLFTERRRCISCPQTAGALCGAKQEQ